MIAATSSAATSALYTCSMAWSESSTETPKCATGSGTWKISPGSGPKLRLYGAVLPVSDIAMKLRPWKPPVKAITALRRVAARAILIEFSTAAAPVENRMVLAAPSVGASALSRSHSSM